MSEQQKNQQQGTQYQNIAGSQYPSPMAGEPEASHGTPTESHGRSTREKGGTFSPTSAKVEGSGGSYSPAGVSLRQSSDQRAGPSLTLIIGLAAVVFVALIVTIFFFAGDANGIGFVGDIIAV